MIDHRRQAARRLTVTVELDLLIRAHARPYAIYLAGRLLRRADRVLGAEPAGGAVAATALAPGVWRVTCRRTCAVRAAGYRRGWDVADAARALLHQELTTALPRLTDPIGGTRWTPSAPSCGPSPA
jgi:hypothetical protein